MFSHTENVKTNELKKVIKIPPEMEKKTCITRPRGYKFYFLLNSTEHKFIKLINVKMP